MSIRAVHNEYVLLELVAKGDQQAFEDLFHAYHQQLAEYIFRLTESQEMTEDIVQDVFIKLWMKRETLPGLNNFIHYLFILSRNHTFNCLRKKANQEVRHREWARQFEEETYMNTAPENDYSTLIETAVSKLPPQQQKVYLLSRHQRLKHEEIAAQLGISAETSKKHIKLALRAITQYVHQHMDTVILLILLSIFANRYTPFCGQPALFL
ncbi:RNA polymerase sigma-70 factor [Chitinophaga sp. MM2321]|uniref:RNA polymerase sigma-70 factor n=1 Tax=Chitinophaga sp. MM2321 TaxID=3137178 RepID=UPI0032D5A544